MQKYEMLLKKRHLSYDLIMSMEVESTICSDNSHVQITGIDFLPWAVEGDYIRFITFGTK